MNQTNDPSLVPTFSSLLFADDDAVSSLPDSSSSLPPSVVPKTIARTTIVRRKANIPNACHFLFDALPLAPSPAFGEGTSAPAAVMVGYISEESPHTRLSLWHTDI